MDDKLQKDFENRKYVFPWGNGHLTFTQFIDGSKAALCPEDGRYYWLYFEKTDTGLEFPAAILEMSEGEKEELEFHDILSDLADANQRGMYPEVADGIRRILTERNIRREVIFTLNTLDNGWIRREPGIIYLISRQVLEFLNREPSGNESDLHTAIGAAVRQFRQ
ncbi:MAG: hypothetical protein HFG80_10245 [Eubacterium sp.]|jgi:hypothetical protein|nr:hypothetical protein [Eubacterium sp.]